MQVQTQRVNLQIPLTKQLKLKSEQAALEMGFTSLQDLVRLFLQKVSDKTINISFTEEVVLSDKAVKRYDKIADEIKRGIALYKARDIDDLMKQLNS